MGLRINKIADDLMWTNGAFAIMASSGLLLNLIVGIEYGAEGLGIFNQALAAYVIASQVSVGGAHLAVFRSVAALDPEADLGIIGASGLLVALAWGLAAGLVLFVTARPLGVLFQSPAVGFAIGCVSLALPLTACNKVLIAILNAQHKMREYALAQSARYLLLLIFTAGVALMGMEVVYAALCFLAAEIVVAVYLISIGSLRRCLRLASARFLEVRQISSFGARAMGSGLAAELNIRSDIVMIGLLMDDKAAGVYALASVIYEGALNAAYVVRTNLNPTLVRITARRDWFALDRLLRTLLLTLNPIAILLLVIGYLGYEPVVGLIFSDQTLYDGLYPLLILIAPLTILAGLVGVDQLLLQSGRAGAYTSVLACGFVVNIGLNYIFIPHIGLSGAAVATATCFSATTLALLGLFCVGEGWRPRWRSR